jgi:protein SCO1/2
MRSNLTLNAAIGLAALLFSCGNKQPKALLPFYGEKQVHGEDTIYHTIGNFSLVDQAGNSINSNTVKNKIYVANFFFATCQSICPAMNKNLIEVQKAFAEDSSFVMLSHSVNPLHDTVEVLKDYAARYAAMPNKWHFLTGDKKQIYDLAKADYLVNALEDDGTPEGFLHSELLILIDKKGRMRGMYDGTDGAQVQKLISEIKVLKTEAAEI